MICEDCKKETKNSDFIGNQTCCYHCMYKKKVKELKISKKNNTPKCRICNKKLFFDENLKKRQRNVFCSEECAHLGQREKSNSHWTRKLRTLVPCKF